MDVKIQFYFHGTFFYKNKKLLYREGSVYESDVIDSDELSRFELERFLEDGAGVVGVKEIWYLHGGLLINEGLRQINTDSDIISMVGAIKDGVAHVYVLLDGDVSPSFLLSGGCGGGIGLRRNLGKRHVTNETNSLNQSIEGNISGLLSTPSNTLQIIGGSEIGVEEVEYELDGDEPYSQQSDSLVDDIKFHESDDEVEDLFDENKNGEPTNGREITELVEAEFAFDKDVTNVQLPESDVAEESDDLRLPDGSDDDGAMRRRYPEFNHHTGFMSPIRLEVGMIFASSDIFRKAISHYSVERGGDFYFLHNDSKRANVQCKKKCDCEWKHCRRACSARNCGTLRCSFRASARRMSEDGSFQLKSLNGVHTRGRQHLNARVTSKFLAEMYIKHYRDDPRLKLTAFMNTVLRDINVKISYSQAKRTRMRACLMLQGDAKEQYAHICDYAETLLAWLIKVGVNCWSKHAFKDFTKSDMLLNNICESWNKFILEARDKPILTCCEWIRRSLMCRFVKKKEGMMKHKGVLTPKAVKRLEIVENIGQEKCTLWCGGSNRFEVELNSNTYVVDMNRRSCSCNKWNLTGIPCSHACAVILSTRGVELDVIIRRGHPRGTQKV